MRGLGIGDLGKYIIFFIRIKISFNEKNKYNLLINYSKNNYKLLNQK